MSVFDLPPRKEILLVPSLPVLLAFFSWWSLVAFRDVFDYILCSRFSSRAPPVLLLGCDVKATPAFLPLKRLCTSPLFPQSRRFLMVYIADPCFYTERRCLFFCKRLSPYSPTPAASLRLVLLFAFCVRRSTVPALIRLFFCQCARMRALLPSFLFSSSFVLHTAEPPHNSRSFFVCLSPPHHKTICGASRPRGAHKKSLPSLVPCPPLRRFCLTFLLPAVASLMTTPLPEVPPPFATRSPPPVLPPSPTIICAWTQTTLTHPHAYAPLSRSSSTFRQLSSLPLPCPPPQPPTCPLFISPALLPKILLALPPSRTHF